MIYMCTKAEKVVLHGFAVGSAFEPQKSSSGTFLHFIFDRLLRSFGVNLAQLLLGSVLWKIGPHIRRNVYFYGGVEESYMVSWVDLCGS